MATLRVNPIACEAHGLCAELLPERITLDDWGYPMIDDRPLPADLVEHAQRAADACPTLALLFESSSGSAWNTRPTETRSRRSPSR